MPSASVAVHLIVVTPFGYAASSANPSLLTPTTVTLAASEVAVATPGSTTAAQDPTAALEAILLSPDSAGGAVATEMFAGGVTTGGCGGANRNASFERLKKPFTRGLTTPVTGFLTLSKAAAEPSRFSTPCVTRLPLLVMLIEFV